MKVVIAGGGSGGHLFPGVAVAEELKRRASETEVVFIGTERGLEARVVPELGYPLRFIPAEGVLGRSVTGKAVSMFKLMRSTMECRRIFRATRPHIVIGTGGYVSAGPVIAARTLGIPTLIMEQNMVPGLANRMLSRFADAVAVTYYESMGSLPQDKVHLTGNPVRASILRGRRDTAMETFSLDAGRFTVLVAGGSAGALHINDAVMNALPLLLEIRDYVQFVHQTGERDYERVRKAYRQMGFSASVSPFLKLMAEAYAAADIVLCRAGATTLAELTALGKAAILVPYPHAAGHQEYNARKLADSGGCVLIRDHDLDGPLLASEIKRLYSSESLRGDMRRQSRGIGRPEAAERVVDLVYAVVKQGRRHV